MEKSYLLLRNNKQLGPFTIDELLQQQLQPTDLIWVEGQSVAWCFPSQIRQLNRDSVLTNRPVEEKSNTSSTKPEKDVAPIFETDLEKRAEALRNRVLSRQEENIGNRRNTASYAQKSYGYLKDRELEVVYHSRKKYVTLPQLLAAGVMTAVIGTAFYSGWTPVKSNSNVANAAVTPLNTTESNAAKAVTVVRDTLKSPIAVDSVNVQKTNSIARLQTPKTEEVDTALYPGDNVQPNQVVAQVLPPVSEPAKEINAGKADINSTPIAEVKEEIKETTGVVIDQEPKKKGFLRNLFKKKKKDKDETEEVE